MRLIGIIGLALAALFALGGVGASTASASLPEWATGGKFPIKETFTSGPGVLETVGERKVTCKSGTGAAEILNAKELVNAVFTGKGCTANGPFGELSCKSTGAAEGEIVTKKLRGTLVYIKKATKEVGVVGEPEEAGGLAVEFTCKGILVTETIKIKGSGLGKISPINTLTTLIKHEATMSKGKPTLTEYENAKGEKVKVKGETKGEGSEPFGYEESAGEDKGDSLFSSAVEARA